MPEAPAYAAVDLGASSGRILTGRLDGGRVALEEVHRFANRPVRLPTGLHWDVTQLFAQALDGLRRAGPLQGIGVDTWGVDYGLLDDAGRLLGLPFHYRDGRSAPMVERAHARASAEDQYAATGIQVLPFNTLFQLLADENTPALAAASRIALMPDLLAFWLSGVLANEATAASTTGLLDARSGRWARDLADRLALPGRLFGEVVEPGTPLGPPLPAHELRGRPTVHAVGGHDTASAFAAAPVADEHAAILSSGTWSLLGLELPAPVLTPAARAANLTNERGIDGTTRLLKNVMGLWLEQECARTWGAGHAELFAEAEAWTAEVPLFDPDDPTLLAPGDMPARIAALCTSAGQPAPAGRGAFVRSILVSLACRYREVLELLEEVGGREVHRIHVIGGGARVEVLCRLTADLTGREVVAGPVEATALGNVLVQARADGLLGSRAELREVAVASARPVHHAPGPDREAADAIFHRFLDLTARSPLRV